MVELPAQFNEYHAGKFNDFLSGLKSNAEGYGILSTTASS